MIKAINILTISILLLSVCVGMLNWQSYESNKHLGRLTGYVNDLNVDFRENLQYEISKVRSQILSNYSIVDTGNVNGRYFSGSMNILVYGKGRPVKSVHNTAIHEIGHYIFHEGLTIDERSEWYNMTFDCYPSYYAEDNSHENFAESYQYWYYDNLTCQPQLDFFNKIKDRLQ